MRFRILPVILFFLFALVVAKVFDLALEKSTRDMQAAAQGKEKTTEAKDKGEKDNQEAEVKGKAKKSASEETAKPDTPNDAASGNANSKSPVPQKGAPKSVEISDQVPMERALLENLAKRRMELDDWANSISMKESVLNATEKKINSKMEELKKLETEVSALLAQYKSKEDEKNKKLVKIYEDMKPAEAAKIFDTMDINILLEIIGSMKEDNAAKILSKMSTVKAKEVTTKLAEQKRLSAK